MNRRLVALGGAVAVIAAIVWYWAPWADTTRPTRDDTVVSEQSGLAARQQARRSGAVDREPGRVSGRVIDGQSGEGIGEALISLRPRRLDSGARARPGESGEPITARSESDGSFVAGDLPPGRYSVAASADGYKPAVIDSVLVVSGQQQDELVLRLDPGGHRIRGHIRDIGGGAVAGALVQVTRTDHATISAIFRAPFTTIADTGGQYAIAVDSGTYSVSVLHPDYVGEQQNVRVDTSDRTLDFVLTPGAVIEGRVLHRSDDSPVAGATVSHGRLGQSGGFVVSGISENAVAVTDGDGRFVLRGLSGGAVELRAWGPGVASSEPTMVELGIAETATDVVIYVDRAFKISGFVVEAGDQDKAVEGAVVGAFNMSPGALYAAPDPSAADGYFEIHGVRPGTYSVGLMAEKKLPNIFGTSVTVEDADIEDVVLEVQRGATVRGRVEPAAVARLSLEIDAENIGLSTIVPAIGAALVSGQSEPDGSFELRGVGYGTFTLKARTDDGREGTLEIQVAEAGLDGLVVELEDRATVSGVVVDDRGAGVEGVQVHLDPRGGSNNFTFNMGSAFDGAAVTGPDGHFEARGVDDGSYNLSVKEDSWMSTLRWADKSGDEVDEPIELTVANHQDIRDLRLVVESRDQTLSGVVIGSDGTPMADAWVTARRNTEAAWMKKVEQSEADDDTDDEDRTRWLPSEDPVLTDAEGRFHIEKLRRGRYNVEAEASRAGARGEVRDVATGSNVTIRLKGLGGLAGTVSHAGQPVTNYVIVLSGPTDRRMVVANPSGKYRLPRLEAGRYRLVVTADVGTGRAEAVVDSGQDSERNLELVNYGSVSGRLVDKATGEPMVGYQVMAEVGDDNASMGRAMVDAVQGKGPRTDADGRFVVSNLPAGKGWLFAFAAQGGFDMIANQRFELAPSQDLDLGDIEGALPSDKDDKDDDEPEKPKPAEPAGH